jgi:hypothetical protein
MLSGVNDLRVIGVAVSSGIAALVIAVLVGPEVLLHPGHSAVGHNPQSDYQIMTWSLEWWPWAVRHGADPLHTQLLWAPFGFSTLWITTIPFQALLGLPITLTAGSLVAYNVLLFLAAPLAAGAAYLLCHELTGRFWPSLVGALIFGLSPYMLGHTLSQHLNLAFVFPVPLLVLLAVRHARGKTSARRFVAGFAALLLMQVGSSLELFVDVTLFLALGLAIALIGAGAQRATVLRTARVIGLSYAICLPVLATIAAVALSAPHSDLQFAPAQFSIDLLNVVVPTQTLLAGSGHSAHSVSQHFVGNVGEQNGYLGVPLLIVALLALRSEWRRGAWLPGGLLIAGLLLSFGPTLTVGGRALVSLPFAIARLPILGYALPVRLSIFTALAAACLCALWLARPHRALLRAGVAALVLVSLLPNLSPNARFVSRWGGSTDRFEQPLVFGWATHGVGGGFTDGRDWTDVVKPGSTVMVLPSAAGTPAGYWQAQSGMRFALAVPGTPFVPPKIAAAPSLLAFLANGPPATAGPRLSAARLRSYLLDNDVRAVVVKADWFLPWGELAADATASAPVMLGNTMVYRVAPGLRRFAASGHVVVAGAPPSRALSAGVWFDGHRGHLRVRPSGSTHSVTLSSPDGDADSPAATVDARGHAAVAFTEWRGRDHEVSVRVATFSHGRWRVVTLDTRREPIGSPKVVIAPNGATIATWVAADRPMFVVRAATLPPGGVWQPPETLARVNSTRTAALSASRGGAVCAWRDLVGTETRVRAATFDGAGWSAVATVASSLQRLPDVAIAGAGSLLRWEVSYPDRHLEFFEARRSGSGWVQPRSPVQTVSRYEPTAPVDPWNRR